MKHYITAPAVAFVLIILAACSQDPRGQGMPANVDHPSIRVGGLYASRDDDGKWRVSKVLAFDGDIVHLRMYANTFTEQPASLDPDKLTLGSIGGPEGFGIGHAPIAKEGFLDEKPVLIQMTEVTPEDLDGYRIYLEAMGGAR